MEPRKKHKNKGFAPDANNSGLSYGVLHVHKKERKPSKIVEFFTQTALFLLGGVILCGILYAIVSYT